MRAHGMPRRFATALEKARVNQVSNAAINDDAGVEQQEVVGLVLPGEADVGDDEGEVLLVAAHGHDHADVAEADEQRHPHQAARDLVLLVHPQEDARVVEHPRHHHAQQQAEGGRRKRAEGKTLEHLINGNEDAAEPHADERPKPARLQPLGPHLAHREATERAEEQEEDADGPERHASAGLGC